MDEDSIYIVGEEQYKYLGTTEAAENQRKENDKRF